VVHGDTDTTPYGLGTYGSRSTPVSAPPQRLWRGRFASGRGSSRPRMLEVSPDDLEWENDFPAHPARWFVAGDPEQGATIQEIAMAVRGTVELPEGVGERDRRGRPSTTPPT